MTKAYFDRLLMIEWSCLTMSIASVGLSVIEYDLEFHEIHTYWAQALLHLILAFSILHAILTVVRSHANLQFKKTRGLVGVNETIFTTREYIPLTAELLTIMIIPYPWFQGVRINTYTLYGEYPIYYHVNDIFQLILPLRIIVWLRVFLHSTVWNDNRAQRICGLHAVEPGFLFTLRSIMATAPSLFVLITYFLSIPYFAYALEIAERPTERLGIAMVFNFLNSMWTITETMSTVGFGDYYPYTFAGRAVIFFVSIWGMTLISLMVVTLRSILKMNPFEQRVMAAFNGRTNILWQRHLLL